MLRRLWIGLCLLPALGALALIVTPAELWSRPDVDLSARGFDANTMFVDQRGARYTFDPFQVLVNGKWTPCPCEAGAQLTLVGSNLAPVSLRSTDGAPSLGPVAVTVDGKRTRVYEVSPGHVNFFLRADVEPPHASIALWRDGLEVGRKSIPIAGGPAQGAAAEPDVTIEREALHLRAGDGASSAVHLLTSPLSYDARLTARIDGGEGGRPLEVMVWSPRTFGGVSLFFGPAPERTIEALVSEGRGNVVERRPLGAYVPGESYDIRIAMRRGESVELSVAPVTDPFDAHTARFSAEQAPALFDAFRPSLTVLSSASGGPQDVVLTDYQLDVRNGRLHTLRIDDGRAIALTVVVLIIAGLLQGPALALAAFGAMSAARLPDTRRPADVLRRRAWMIAPAALLIAAAVWVMSLGSHPFDMGSQKAWTYLLLHFDPRDVYYRAQTVPLAPVWDGMPFHEAVFPYGVGMAYFFVPIGWLHEAFGGDATPSSGGLEVTIKLANAAVAFADAAIVFALVRGFGRGARFSALVAAAFLLNPAFLFDLLIWGETESIALFFLLASLLAAQRGSPLWAWSLLAMAALGKQTVIIPAFLVGAFYLRRFDVIDTLRGLSLALPLTLLLALPFIAGGYPPSIVIDPILGAFMVFGGSEIEDAFKVASFDSYNVWSMVTLWQHDAHGLARLQMSDQTLLAGMAYHRIGSAMFMGTIAALAGTLLVSRRTREDGGMIFIVLAIGTLASLVLPTRSIARYLIFPMTFALIGSGATRPRTMWPVFTALTLTSLTGMYGSVASGLDSRAFADSALAPANNPVSQLALTLFRSDAVITAGAVANIAALGSLAAALWWPRRVRMALPERRPARRWTAIGREAMPVEQTGS